MLTRSIQPLLQKQITENKILLLIGPKGNSRKETLVELFPSGDELAFFECGLKQVKAEIETGTAGFISKQIGSKKYLVLDEAQLLSNLQEIIEFVLFEQDQLGLICCCSFLPHLHEDLMEALNSQGLVHTLHSPGFHEIASSVGIPQFEKSLNERLVFGNFEEVLSDTGNAADFLNGQVAKILETKISSNDRINKKESLLKLLQYLAFTIGEHVSYHEVGEKCGLDNETVERYIDLLVKSYVIVKIPVFFNDKKYELKKANCFYFYDNGIRNTLINNFNDIDLRMDANQLWKNWLIVEKIKLEASAQVKSEFFFWKTHTRQTVDLIQIHPAFKKAFQFQWLKKEKRKFPASFVQHYPDFKTIIINKSTYWSFLTK